jgi:ssDNA-binding Zn-finger/Zn-ribbon topoisomerase 1
MDRTRNSTEDSTKRGLRTEDRTPDNTDEEEYYEPPCREAARYVVPCPTCGRRLQIKTLKYSHVCGRSFSPTERAIEQKKAAEAAASARMRQYSGTERAATMQNERAREHAVERAAESKGKNYSHLLKF